MNIEKRHKVLKRILLAIMTVIIMVAVIVAIVVVRLKNKPQMIFAEAVANTFSSAKESEFNSEYGIYDIVMGMLNGSLNVSYDSADSEYSAALQREPDSHRFLMEVEVSDTDYKLYVNDKTSLIYIDDTAIAVDYTGDLATKLNNSLPVSLMDIDSEYVGAFAQAYQSCMQLAADTGEDKDDSDSDIPDKLIQYILEADGQKEGSQTLTYGGHTENCDLYSVVIDTDELKNIISGIEDIDKGADVSDDISQIVCDILSAGEIRIYFAINDSDELVKLYAEDISEDDISVTLMFDGEDYIAQSWSLSVIDKSGKGFEAGLSLSLEDDNIAYEVKLPHTELSGAGRVTAYEKGRYVELTDDSGAVVRIGCDAVDIKKPEYTDRIDIFDMDIFSAYRFISKYFKEYMETTDGQYRNE